MTEDDGEMMITEIASTPISIKQQSSSSSDNVASPTTVSHSPFSDQPQHQYVNEYALKRFASTPVISYSTALDYTSPASVNNESVKMNNELVEIPIVGYEVMEERARFTVYKLRIENKSYTDSWFVFRRYTDFVRLHSKLKIEFPKNGLILPRKRWFGNNFNANFIEERIRGLQAFIDGVTRDKKLLSSASVRDFFCLDEPPTYSESGEESRAVFEALEETIYHLRLQLREKEAELDALKLGINLCQEKAVTLTQRIIETTSSCGKCNEVEPIATELQRLFCAEFSEIS